jgi:hypothetical protein
MLLLKAAQKTLASGCDVAGAVIRTTHDSPCTSLRKTANAWSAGHETPEI